MARTALPLQQIPNQGRISTLVWTAADATNDHEFINDGLVMLLCRNTDASPKTVTVVSVADENGRTGDVVAVVPAAVGSDDGVSIVGPLKAALFNQSTGKVNVDIAADTGLSFAAVRMFSR